MSAVAKGFRDRSTATAEGKCGFPGEIVALSVGIDQLDRPCFRFDPVWAVLSNSDFHLCHPDLHGKRLDFTTSAMVSSLIPVTGAKRNVADMVDEEFVAKRAK